MEEQQYVCIFTNINLVLSVHCELTLLLLFINSVPQSQQLRYVVMVARECQDNTLNCVKS